MHCYGPRREPWRETLSQIAVRPDDGKLLVTAPSSDPLRNDDGLDYPFHVSHKMYQVPSTGLITEDHDAAMKEIQEIFEEGARHMLGYASNQEFQCPQLLSSPLTDVLANNGGDPFDVSRPTFQAPKWVEHNVLDYFASLWNAKWPHDPEDPETYWGYVLTMGSSEGTLHAMWSARNYLTADIPHAANGLDSTSPKPPVLFFSRNANFSLSKLANVVQLSEFHEVGRQQYPHQNPLGGEWTSGVPCIGGDAGPGTIDIDALDLLVDFFSSRGHPIMVIFNYAATFKGGCDDVQTAGERLVKTLKKNNMYERKFVDPSDPEKTASRQGYWVHIDGAMAAAYMPFFQMAHANGLTDIRPASVFDFRLEFVSSIVFSAHKFIGTPWPSGVYMTRSKLLNRNTSDLTMVGFTDTTISLSRNAHSVLLLWSFISRNSYDSQVSAVLRCLDVVPYAIRRLKELEKKIGIDLRVKHFPPSLCILFRKPNPRIMVKHTLLVKKLIVDSTEQDFAQMYVMRHVTKERIDSFITELEAADAFL